MFLFLKQLSFLLLPIFTALQASAKEDEGARAYLLTMGATDKLYSNAGHSVLRIIDKKKKKDLVYNWGIFDFKAEQFLLKFYKETLDYKLFITDGTFFVDNLLKKKERYVSQHEILLSQKEKERFFEKLSFWEKRENRKYRYHSFKNNCATVIRDLIDYAKNGAIKRKSMAKKTPFSYRDVWHHYFSSVPYAAIPAQLLFNRKIDHKTSSFEIMFAPEKLQEELLALGVLGSSRVLVDKPFRNPQYPGSIYFLCALMALPIALFLYYEKYGAIRKIKYRALAIGVLPYALLSFLLGAFIVITSLVTERDYFHFSPNLWLFWPVDFILVLKAYSYLRPKKAGSTKSRFSLVVKPLILGHLIANVLYVLLWLFGVIKGDANQTISFLPLSFLIYLTLWREIGRSKGDPSEKLEKVKEKPQKKGAYGRSKVA